MYTIEFTSDELVLMEQNDQIELVNMMETDDGHRRY